MVRDLRELYLRGWADGRGRGGQSHPGSKPEGIHSTNSSALAPEEGRAVGKMCVLVQETRGGYTDPRSQGLTLRISLLHPHNQGPIPGPRPAVCKLNAGEISVSSCPVSTNCPVLEFSPPRSQEAEGPFEISKGKYPWGASMGLLALLRSRASGIAVLLLKASSFPSLNLLSFFSK